MKVLYVLGCGRSGSTVLDILLGSHPEVVGTGELARLVRSGWLNTEICACGALVNDCAFWSAVHEAWVRDIGADASGEYIRVQKWMERLRRFPNLVRRTGIVHPNAQRYRMLTVALLEAIATASGRALIVDSSKVPIRALALSRIPGVELFVVHLVRDDRAVAWSSRKHFDKDPRAGVQRELRGVSVWRTSLVWDLANVQSEWMRTQIPTERSIRLRYEDLVRDPREALSRIGALVNVDFSGVAEAVANGVPLRVSHPVAGNRLRMDHAIRIVSHDSWRTLMSARDQRLAYVLAWPMMKHYGYR